MSYPGFPNTNLAADVGTHYGVNGSYYASANAVAGIPDQLQSPAQVLPSAAGNCVLNFTATQPNGVSEIQVISGANQPASVLLAGAGAGYYVGNTNTGHFTVEAAALAVGQGAAIDYTALTGVLNLGDGSVAGFVSTNQELKVGGNSANFITLASASATTSNIAQSVATSGILNIGSSLTNTAVFQVADLVGDATMYVRSADGQVPLAFRSNNTGSSIIPGAANNSNIVIGSSAANPAAIAITDTATNINQLGGAPQVLYPSTNLPPSTPAAPFLFVFPAPVGQGLYAICGASSGISTANSRQAQLSCICYVNATGVVAIGGAAYADLGSIGSDDNIQWAPISNNSFSASYGGVQQVNNFQVLAFKISGPIPGTF